MKAISSLPLASPSARSGEFSLETVISMFRMSPAKTRVVSASQLTSWPLRKPTAKIDFSGLAGGFAGGLHLRQRKARMVEKDSAGIGELDAARAPDQQLRADLMFQVSDLTAQRWLGRMQPALSGDSQAALLGDGDEIPKVPQLPAQPHACEVCPSSYKVFFLAATR